MTVVVLCEILLVEAKKVLLNIIVIRKNLICIYFQHTFTSSRECKSVLKVNANEVFPYHYDTVVVVTIKIKLNYIDKLLRCYNMEEE